MGMDYPSPGARPLTTSSNFREAWLGARPEQAREFMRAYPAQLPSANPVEQKR